MMMGILIAAVTLGGAPPPSPSPGRVRASSWEQAESLRVKLLELERRARAAREAAAAPAKATKGTETAKTTKTTKTARTETVVVTQGEVNSYVNLVMQPRFPVGLSDVDFRLETDRLIARGMVDLEKVKDSLKANSVFNPLSLLSGKVSLEARGRLRNKEDGFGVLEVEEVRLGPMMVPPSLLYQLVASATRTPQNPQGFDVLAPFRFPYSLKKVRLQQGKALLEL